MDNEETAFSSYAEHRDKMLASTYGSDSSRQCAANGPIGAFLCSKHLVKHGGDADAKSI